MLRSWEHRFGVRVVGLGHGSLYLSVAAQPTGARQARVLAAEHHLACPDIFHELPELDWSTYHEELMQLREWQFWWDCEWSSWRGGSGRPPRSVTRWIFDPHVPRPVGFGPGRSPLLPPGL